MQLFRIPLILKLVYGVRARYNICWFPRELDNIFHAIGIFSYRGSNVMKLRLPTSRGTFACSLYWIQNVRNMDFIHVMKTHKVQLRIWETFNQNSTNSWIFPSIAGCCKTAESNDLINNVPSTESFPNCICLITTLRAADFKNAIYRTSSFS